MSISKISKLISIHFLIKRSNATLSQENLIKQLFFYHFSLDQINNLDKVLKNSSPGKVPGAFDIIIERVQTDAIKFERIATFSPPSFLSLLKVH